MPSRATYSAGSETSRARRSRSALARMSWVRKRSVALNGRLNHSRGWKRKVRAAKSGSAAATRPTSANGRDRGEFAEIVVDEQKASVAMRRLAAALRMAVGLSPQLTSQTAKCAACSGKSPRSANSASTSAGSLREMQTRKTPCCTSSTRSCCKSLCCLVSLTPETPSSASTPR